MDLKEKLDKIDSEIEMGLKFKSSDRLRNLIQDNPNEIQLWYKLAELYYESGFLDAAGKYWILTEPTEERIRKCVSIYEKSVNYSGYQILQDIVFRGDKSKLNDYAKSKLAELELSSREQVNYIPEYKPKRKKSRVKKGNSKINFKDKLISYAIYGILILLLISMLIGLVTLVGWLF